jgi:hypothetical protein
MRRIVNLIMAVIFSALLACSGSSTDPQDTTVDALLVVEPTTGTVLTDFVFDASGTTSTTRSLEYRWDWNDDGEWDTEWSAESVQSHRFETDNATVTVEARSGNGSDQSSETLSLDLRHGEIISSLRILEDIIPKDITWDGHQFWILGSIGSQDSLYRISSTTGLITISHGPPVSWPNALTWDGSHLWVTDNTGGENTRLFQINPASGIPTGSFVVEYTNRDSGLDYRDDAFYHGSAIGNSAGDNRIHKYDHEGNEILAFDTPEGTTGPRGLAYDGESLWVIAYGSESIFVVDADTGDIERSLEIPGHQYKPFIVDGYLWLPFLEMIDDEESLVLKKIVP